MTTYVVNAQTINVSTVANTAQTILSLGIPFESINVTSNGDLVNYSITANTGNANFNIEQANVSFSLTSNQYTYTITSANGIFNQITIQSPQYAFNINSQPILTAPSAPTNVLAVAGNTTVNVSWNPSSSNGGSPITSYTVASTDGLHTYVKTDYSTNATPVTMTLLTNNQSYTFNVYATNASGNSTPGVSNSVIPNSNNTVPGAPTGVNAVVANGTAVTVSWVPPTSNGGTPIIDYIVASTDGLHTYVKTDYATNTNPVTMTLLTTNQSYQFNVIANNAVGNSAPGVSNSVTPTNSGTPPSAIGNFLLVNQGGNNQVNNPGASDQNTQIIAWSAASQGGNPISGYRIFRNNVAIANVSSSTGLYTDTTALGSIASIGPPNNNNYNGAFNYPANVYSYIVKAFDTAGLLGPAPTQQAFWHYKGGFSAWGTQSNYNAGGMSMNYSDTSGSPQAGSPTDIKVNITQGSAGDNYLQLYANTPNCSLWVFESGAFNYFTIDLKPTVSGQTWRFNMISRVPPGDVFNSAQIVLGDSSAKYGPQAQAGVWARYKIPMGKGGCEMGNTTFTGYVSGTTLTVVTNPTGCQVNPTMWISTPGGFTTDYISGSSVQGVGSGAGYTGTYQLNLSHGNWGSAGSPITFTGQRTECYKWSLIDLTGLNNNTYYMDNIGFLTS